MATLLQHADAIRQKFSAAFADKRVSFAEVLQLVGVIIDAASCTLEKVQDDSQFSKLVDEAESLYDDLLDPAVIDIPRVPEWAETYVIGIGRQMIRPALESLVDALDEVQ